MNPMERNYSLDVKGLMGALGLDEPPMGMYYTDEVPAEGFSPKPGMLPSVEAEARGEVDWGRVFENFYRPAGVAAPSGIGLGLTICRGIITAHGGRIWAERRPGGGAAFHFTIPLSGPPPEAPPVEAEIATGAP